MPPKATTAKVTKQGSHTSSKQKFALKTLPAHKMGAKADNLYKKKNVYLEDASDESLSYGSVASNSPLQNTLFTNLSKNERLEKMIAAIDLRESSSSHPISVESYEEQLEEVEELDTKSSKFMELSSKLLGISFESEDSISDDIDYVSQSTTYSEDDFFEHFQTIPEVDQMSVDTIEEVKPQAIVTRVKRRTYYEDGGKFVNPLTGELSVSDVSEIPSVEVVAPVRVQVQASESSEAQRYSFQSPDSVFSDTSAVVAKKPTTDVLEDIKEGTQVIDEDQEAYLQFLELEAKEKEAEQLTAEQFQLQAEKLMKEQLKQLNFEQTMDFLNNLIDQVVEKAEYIDENVILRKNLDKRKIITELGQVMDELSKEKSLMVFLNRKCSHYFRRKSGHQHIGNDYSRERKEKFYQNLIIFSEMLEKEKETQIKCKERIRQCKEQYEIAKKQTDEEIRHLEKLITSTFHLDRHHNLKASVNSQLTKLSEFRETVSRVRLRLLIDQHNFTELSMRMEKLEDLGHGLNLKDYDNLATENKTLTKKIEERDVMLEKLKTKCNGHVHTLAHIKGKQRWMRKIVSVQDDVLAEILEDKTDIRRYINTLRLKRMKLKQEIREISFQCGLLDKPILMLDYDDTVETANKLRHSNGELKKTVERLKKKIAVLEDMCAQRKSIVKVVQNPLHV